jgi:hypothetical protein
MNTIVQHNISKTSCFFIGIVKAGEWFEKIPFPFQKDDFVVCQWFDYHGQNSHFEGKTTIAVCKELTDAEVLYEHKKKTWK